MLLTHSLAFSASQFEHKKKFPTNFCEYALDGVTYTRLEDNLIRHRGDRQREEHTYYTNEWK